MPQYHFEALPAHRPNRAGSDGTRPQVMSRRARPEHRPLAALLALSLSLSQLQVPAWAATLEASAQASGGESRASSQQGWSAAGEPAIGTSSGPTTTVTLGFLSAVADITPPTGTLTINSGAPYTTTATVTLALSAADDAGAVTQMQLSTDGQQSTEPEPYALTTAFRLTSGDGQKTVSVRFSDSSGNWSPPVSASIILDVTPPHVIIQYPPEGSRLGGASP